MSDVVRGVSDSLTAEEYPRIRKVISASYSVALTDCGTGVTHNAMKGILQLADNLIIAAGYAVSGAKRARALCSGSPATAARTWPGTGSW